MKTKLLQTFFLFGTTICMQAQVVRYVVPGGAGAANGSSWADGSASISAMITASATNDEIWVAAGTYTLASTITVGKTVKIYGGFAGTETTKDQRQHGENGWYTINETILDGDSAINRVIDIEASNALINGLSITGGIYGGVEIARANNDINSAEVSYCRIHHNGDSSASANNGGGIYTNRAYLTRVLHNYIGYNKANEFGGGIYCSGGSNSIIIDGNTIVHNIANTSNGYNGGGGFYSKEIQYHNSKIINNIFAYNRSGSGAAIFTENGGGGTSINQMPFFNNTIYGNVGSGAIKSRHTHIRLMYNCILYGNSSNGDISNAKYSCIQGGGTTNGNINTNPLFISPDSATVNFRLQPGSPCIDTGYKQISIRELGIRDAADSFRIYSATSGKPIVDMGAIEFRTDSLIAYVTPADSQYIILPDTTGIEVTVSASNKTISGYQWKYGTASGIYSNTLAGEVLAAYTPVFPAPGTYYVACIASAGSQTITTNEIKVVVQGPLAISIAPIDTQILKVSAYGDTLKTTVNKSVSYQWKYGTTTGNYPNNITGATNSFYVPRFTNPDTYFVVCNGYTMYETINSNDVVIIVEPLLNVTVAPSATQLIAVNLTQTGTLLTATTNLTGVTYQWKYGTAPGAFINDIAGAVNSTYLPDTADFNLTVIPDTAYIVCVATRGAEKDTSATVMIRFDISSSVSQQTTDDELLIYPVPAVDHLFISSHQPILSVTLTAVNGAVIAQWNNTNRYLSLKGISAGMYILTVQTEQNVIRKNLIIQ